MNFSSILLAIMDKLDGERSIYAAFHILRGKRSGQTLQDVEYYRLKSFFAIIPKLSKALFDEAADELLALGYVHIDETALVHITEKGKQFLKELPTYHFNGWDYRGREEVFFARLSLVVQTLSHFRAGSTVFMPAQRDAEVQLFVKALLHNEPIRDRDFSRRVQEELMALIQLSGMQDIQKVILTHRLVGYGHTGWTWGQLAEMTNMSPVAVKLYFTESLHLLLGAIEKSPHASLCAKIAQGIKVVSHLTDSSMRTKLLFEKGHTMEEIAAMRRLKMSTIEDHFTEMAINEPSFPLEHFVSKTEINKVSQKSRELGTKRLRLLKDSFPELSYFQLRLILGATSGGEMKWTSNRF